MSEDSVGGSGDDQKKKPRSSRPQRWWLAPQYWWVPLVAVALAAWLGNALRPPDNRKSSVTGEVSVQGGAAEVRVDLGDRIQNVSPPKRRFTFADVTPGPHELLFSAIGYRDSVVTIEVGAASTFEIPHVRLRVNEAATRGPIEYSLSEAVSVEDWSKESKWTPGVSVQIAGAGPGVSGEEPSTHTRICITVDDDQRLVQEASAVQVSVSPHQGSWGRFTSGPTWDPDGRTVCYVYKNWYEHGKTGTIRARYQWLESSAEVKERRLRSATNAGEPVDELEWGGRYVAELATTGHRHFTLTLQLADGSSIVVSDTQRDPRVSVDLEPGRMFVRLVDDPH